MHHPHHCCDEVHHLGENPPNHRQKKILRIVLAIHVSMFLITLSSGLISGSSVIMADSADFLGHIFLLSLSLYATSHGKRWLGWASLIKGATMLVASVSVLVDAFHRWKLGTPPSAAAIGLVGALGVLANLTTLALLNQHRNSDLNMKSSWFCSRNDVVTHVGILLASVTVAATGARWPDTVLAVLISGMILRSALHVIRLSVEILRNGRRSVRNPRRHAASRIRI